LELTLPPSTRFCGCTKSAVPDRDHEPGEGGVLISEVSLDAGPL